MSMWTSYTQSAPAGVAGGLYDLTDHVVDSRMNEETTNTLKPGMGVVQGKTAGTTVKMPALGDTVEKFEGIVMNDVREMDMQGNVSVNPKTTVSVMRSGRIWVRIAEGVQPKYGDPVYLIINGAGLGCFKTAADGANTLELNARFIGGKDTSDIAPIMLHDQMHKTAPAAEN